MASSRSTPDRGLAGITRCRAASYQSAPPAPRRRRPSQKIHPRAFSRGGHRLDLSRLFSTFVNRLRNLEDLMPRHPLILISPDVEQHGNEFGDLSTSLSGK